MSNEIKLFKILESGKRLDITAPAGRQADAYLRSGWSTAELEVKPEPDPLPDTDSNLNDSLEEN